LDKALVTNLIALLLVLLGLVSPVYAEQLLATGLFALSGAITNWLAIHMLFERIPFLYGSGVIPARFEEFKQAIRELVMDEFFNEANVRRFIAAEEANIGQWIRPGQILDAVDYDKLFNRLSETIMNSSFGNLLAMIGGKEALGSLRLPFMKKIKQSLAEMLQHESLRKTLARSVDTDSLSKDMQHKIAAMVDQRLEELTPETVKRIVQRLIRQHLGWLVVWGGVFGGMIGLLVSFA